MSVQSDEDDEYLATIERVRALHVRYDDDGVAYCGWDGHDGCGFTWPCPTIRAIEGPS